MPVNQRYHSPEQLLNRVVNGMRDHGHGDRTPHMREAWGEQGLEKLINYLTVACAPMEHGAAILREDIRRNPTRKTMIFGGERCAGAQQDGSDNPILLAVAEAANTLAPVSFLSQGTARTGREPNALSIVFSGAVRGNEAMGEIAAEDLVPQFNRLTDGRFAAITQIDGMSINTGDQGRVLGGLLYARRIERVVFCLPIDHVARFAATVMRGLYDTVTGLKAQYPNLTYNPPEAFFLAPGDWDAYDPRRKAQRAQEAFGPVQTVDEAVKPTKLLGDEYGAKRYFAEQNPQQNQGFACGCLSPAQMLALIPNWVKERCLPTALVEGTGL